MPLDNPTNDKILDDLTANIINEAPTLTQTSYDDGGVGRMVISWSAHRANIGGKWYDIAAGSVTLNAADVTDPTNYYIYSYNSGGLAVVVASAIDPEVNPAIDYEYAWLAIARIKSVGGTVTIYYVREAYLSNEFLLHFIGEFDYYNVPTWVSGGGLTINATTGVVDMEELEYRRMRYDREIEAITAGSMLFEDESAAVANLELITTYSDGSAITGGKYHKVLFGVIVGEGHTNPFFVVRQGKPDTEYATLEEARIDALNVAATSFPFTYRGGIFNIAYIYMLVGDASDLATVDIRATGAGGSGGGGGAPIADHSALVNLGADDHLQYLRTDGTRTLTGDMTVTDTKTIDGVDISVHATTANAHHNPITLDANADTVLALSTQELGLDTQTANKVLSGPTTGAVAVPTFRSLVAADIPAVTATMPYTMQSDSTTQAIASIANAQVITFNTSEVLSGITKTSTSRFTIITAGTYLIALSAIPNLATTPGDKEMEIWLRVNAVDVPRSNTAVHLKDATQKSTLAVTFLYTFTAGQYFEIWTWGNSTNCRWLATAAGTSPTRPAVPSIIMTANMVSA